MNESPQLLAIECATLPASVAVVTREGVACELVHRDDQRADAWVGLAVQHCLRESGLDLADIDGFVAGVGPGTFTGIRVGIATALGLAAPRALPVCGVRSLDALALLGSARSAGHIAACIDARRKQVYAAIYGSVRDIDGPTLAPLWGPMVCDPEEVVRRIGEHEGSPLIIGSGAACLGELASLPAGGPVVPIAGALGRLALCGWPEGSAAPQDWPAPVPVYLRPPDARPPRNPLLEARRARIFEQP